MREVKKRVKVGFSLAIEEFFWGSRVELPGKSKGGSAQRRFMDVVEEDMQGLV